METGTAINVKYWILSDQRRNFDDLDRHRDELLWCARDVFAALRQSSLKARRNGLSVFIFRVLSGTKYLTDVHISLTGFSPPLGAE